MTIAYLHLVRLTPASSQTPASFTTLIRQHATSYRYTPLVTSHARHWVARPASTHRAAINQAWDVLLVLLPPSGDPADLAHAAAIPNALSFAVADVYTLKLAVPSALLADYEAKNATLRAKTMPEFDLARLDAIRAQAARLKSSSQNLEASPELLEFAKGLMGEGVYGDRPVTMLNLLRFNDGEPGRESYKRYGKAFGEDVGRKRGGVAKIVGKVLDGEGNAGGAGKGGWDEVAVVHYPNMVAFCDMASAEDYQKANGKWRLPALKDTLLMCTTEAEPQGSPAASKL